MTAQTEEREAAIIEELAAKAEILLAQDDSKRDLKEKRGIMKQAMYDGSKKLKHLVPKGKQF